MKNKLLVYDDHCPFCSWYSGLFVRTGFLAPGGRAPFSTLENSILKQIDFSRSRNEIPLVDLETGETVYGIDALLTILGSRYPFVQNIGSRAPVKWCLQKVYKLISYNRKLVTGTRCHTGAIDCSPDMNYRYRVLFLALCLVLNTLLLIPVHAIILSRLPGYDLTIVQLQYIHFALVAINCSMTLAFRKQRAFEYIGQVNMLALLTILMLCPLLLLSSWGMPAWGIIIYLLLTAIVIFREYLRRMEYAGVLQSHKWVAGINLTTLVGFMLVIFN